MANPRQKRKRLSSRPLVRQKPKSKRLAIKTNPIIAKNWDRKATLSQNYQRLGLTARLNGATGGIERKNDGDATAATQHGLAFGASDKGVGSVKVVRDSEGKIVEVVRETKRRRLAGDLLDASSDEEEDVRTKDTDVVRQLEEHSRMVARKKKRKMGKGESEWIERLVKRWGDDFEGMSRDSQRNPMLKSPSELRKKVRAWRESRSAETGQETNVG